MTRRLSICKEVGKTLQNLAESFLNLYFSAQDLGKEQKLNFGDDIASQLRLARKKRWNLQEEKRITQEIELQTYLNRLIKEDMEREMEKLKLDEALNDEAKEDESTRIEQQSVRNLKFHNLSLAVFKEKLPSRQIT